MELSLIDHRACLQSVPSAPDGGAALRRARARQRW
jgi:hypothetical protein